MFSIEVGLEDDTATVEFYPCRCIMAANKQNCIPATGNYDSSKTLNGVNAQFKLEKMYEKKTILLGSAENCDISQIIIHNNIGYT